MLRLNFWEYRLLSRAGQYEGSNSSWIQRIHLTQPNQPVPQIDTTPKLPKSLRNPLIFQKPFIWHVDCIIMGYQLGNTANRSIRTRVNSLTVYRAIHNDQRGCNVGYPGKSHRLVQCPVTIGMPNRVFESESGCCWLFGGMGKE